VCKNVAFLEKMATGRKDSALLFNPTKHAFWDIRPFILGSIFSIFRIVFIEVFRDSWFYCFEKINFR